MKCGDLIQLMCLSFKKCIKSHLLPNSTSTKSEHDFRVSNQHHQIAPEVKLWQLSCILTLPPCQPWSNFFRYFAKIALFPSISPVSFADAFYRSTILEKKKIGGFLPQNLEFPPIFYKKSTAKF